MLLAVLLSGLLPISQSASEDIARAEMDRLQACIEKTETAPEEAFEDSLAWLSNGNRPKARYCNALSLLALDRLEEGAARLEALATAPDAIELQDRIIYLAQAGNAWLAGNYPDAAIVALSEALKLEQDDPDIYKDRAAAYLAIERWIEGVDDLNAALQLNPGDAEALSLRARAHLATENLPAARADMEEALALDPENIDILVLRGDIREAIRLSELN
ncbi:MAG: tetratricopeptide repeat protein [Hyphomonadaceae bacterium]|nr:tetratricopeptide repeat protein [Hyphomonadaceae bacterium]